MTEPLWGVGSTSPYGHDGRSINLEEVILRHGGEAENSKNAFSAMLPDDQRRVIEFLESLVLFPPDDTASNLNPGSRDAHIQDPAGHGTINLGALFQIADLTALPTHLRMRRNGERAHFTWFGAAGKTYAIEQSVDMRTWIPLYTTNGTRNAFFEVDLRVPQHECFFRLAQN